MEKRRLSEGQEFIKKRGPNGKSSSNELVSPLTTNINPSTAVGTLNKTVSESNLEKQKSVLASINSSGNNSNILSGECDRMKQSLQAIPLQLSPSLTDSKVTGANAAVLGLPDNSNSPLPLNNEGNLIPNIECCKARVSIVLIFK